MTNYAQIPTDLICRFSELTKREIVVLSFLYASRNRQTGRCNPSRGAIARATGVAKPHVSQAVKTLDDKGWIFEEPDGNYILIAEPETVTKSVTLKVTKTVTGGLPICTAGVTNSVTKGYQNGHPHIKDLEQKNEQKNIEQREEAPLTAIADDLVISEIEKAFGLRLDLTTRRLCIQSVPSHLLEFFPAFIRGRAVGYSRRTEAEKLARISYALTDFQKDNRNGTSTKHSEREKSAARTANAYRLADELERVGRAEIQAGITGAKPKSLLGGVDSDHHESDFVS